MTQPSGDQPGQQPGPGDQSGQQSGQGKKAAAPKVKRLDVVLYTHRDRILGGSHQAVGVVDTDPADGGPVSIRPLQGHSVQVDPADVAGVVSDSDV